MKALIPGDGVSDWGYVIQDLGLPTDWGQKEENCIKCVVELIILVACL